VNVFSTFFKNKPHHGRLNGKVLVLNQDYEPLNVCSVKKAIVLLLLGKAELIEAYEGRVLRSVSRELPFPSVVRLSLFVHIPFKRIILSRKNILRRDNHRCQYCGRTDPMLTVDHIHPRSRGGTDSWDNLVCACVGCNNRKGDRTPEEAGMPLLRKPIKPNHVTFIRHFVGNVTDKWKPYLFMQ
jgi:5-methylcytosine-specific restriction endonuclease McrA